MNNYLISITDKNKNDAGPKAKRDIEHFLAGKFHSVTLKYDLKKGWKSRLQKLYLAHVKVPAFFKNHPDIDNLVLQYPLYSTYLLDVILTNLKKYTQAKLYLVIHDLESLRLFKDNPNYVQSEINFLNQADGLIVHNHKMIAWLQANGCTSKLIDLEIFDYDNPQPLLTTDYYDASVCFAGNLAKADFLTKLNLTKHQLILFGPNPSNNYPQNIAYQGQKTPEELPKFLQQSFGLVWDGDSLSSCTGTFGEYMKYNNPHKVSLYLSSGLPVIIWKEAALADFVEKHHVGLTIADLNDLDDLLDRLTPADYALIRQNVAAVANKMRQGYYIKRALKQLKL